MSPIKNKNQTLGIIGGMGPLATIELQKLILEYTPAECDQDHLSVIVHNNSQIPDRTRSLAENGGDAFIKEIVATGRKLIASGATVLCMPCNTAHARFDEIQAELSRPLLNMVGLTLDEIQKNEISTPVLILATNGTIKEKVFQKAMKKHGVPYLLPPPCQQDRLMEIIYKIKAGKKSEVLSELQKMIPSSGRILLACTELGLCEQELQASSRTLINPLRILGKYSAENITS
jgi:aspartate racemase